MHILRYKFRCLKKYTPPAKWGAAEAFGIIIRVLCQNESKSLDLLSFFFTIGKDELPFYFISAPFFDNGHFPKKR